MRESAIHILGKTTLPGALIVLEETEAGAVELPAKEVTDIVEAVTAIGTLRGRQYLARLRQAIPQRVLNTRHGILNTDDTIADIADEYLKDEKRWETDRSRYLKDRFL